MASMLAAKLRGDFHLVSANVVNHARLTWVHGMLGAMKVGHRARLLCTPCVLGCCCRGAAGRVWGLCLQMSHKHPLTYSHAETTAIEHCC